MRASFRCISSRYSPGDKINQCKLRDVGPWTLHKTITNDIENVVKVCVKAGYLSGEMPGLLEYEDSEGELTKVRVENGEFVAFIA